MSEPKPLSPDERNLILGALDSLAVALAEHGHEWTVGEREIYVQAVSLLGGQTAEK